MFDIHCHAMNPLWIMFINRNYERFRVINIKIYISLGLVILKPSQYYCKFKRIGMENTSSVSIFIIFDINNIKLRL